MNEAFDACTLRRIQYIRSAGHIARLKTSRIGHVHYASDMQHRVNALA